MRFSAVFLRSIALAALTGIAAACGDDDPTGLNVPPTPTGLTAVQQTDGSILVSWTAASGADSYRLERTEGTSGTFTQVGGTLTATSFTDTDVEPGVQYGYRVSAVNSEGTSAASAVVMVGGSTGPGAATISEDITASRTLFADTLYTLQGYIKVTNGAVLTIQPGTTIVGDAETAGSSLWILRGARIEANGTADAPIVFTSEKAAGSRAPGDWGGIIIVGNGIINRVPPAGTPILTEGGVAGEAEDYAGGTNNADNSGILRYVRVEFAGLDISGTGGQELNGLSMYAVGSGTQLEYVEVMSGLDDSFEWWGGAVDGRYLLSYEAGDDHFDWSEGYRGRNQFLVAFKSVLLQPAPNRGELASDPRGIEADGCAPDPGTFCTLTETGASTPYSGPVFANFAVVGPGTTVAGFPEDGNGVVLRRGTGGTLDRGIVARWPGFGLNGRDAWTDSLRLRDSLSITNMVLAENTLGNYDPADDDFFQEDKFAGSNHRTAATAAELFTSLNPGANGQGFDWRPTAASPTANVEGEVVPPLLAARVTGYTLGAWETTTYVGPAAPTGTTWWLGWSNYATN
jgi:Fibronectin type III domain